MLATYSVRFTLPSGHRWTTATAGADRSNDFGPTYGTDSDVTVTTSTIALTTTGPIDANGNPLTLTNPTINANPAPAFSALLAAGQSDLTVDLGIFAPVGVGKYVWDDLNGDGIQDAPATAGLNGVTVTLYAPDGLTPTASDVDRAPAIGTAVAG